MSSSTTASTGPVENHAARGFTSQTSRTRCDQALDDEVNGMEKLSLKSPHCDLLNFLAAANKARIDYLPLSWYSTAPVGRGGYATVNESVVHANLSFAYRRASNWRGGPEGSPDGEQDFEAAMMELTILSHTPIEEHDNIITLEGISWEVVPEESRIMPVFVYERMPHGDLWRFRNSPEYKNLGLNNKLALCLDMGEGLLALHSCEVIHGDIKPQNILIGRTEEVRRLSIKARFIAKIADFGSSRVCQTDDMTFHFPETNGWTAPEHHHRGDNAVQGYGMDLYRFCLTCLWLLVNERVGAVDARSAQDVINAVREASDPCQKAVEVIASLGYDLAITERLQKLFGRALAKDRAARQRKLKTILALLNPKWKENTKESAYYSKPRQISNIHSRFSVSWALEQLLCSNYLVRKLIFRCLKAKALSSPCKRCRRFSAFQTAFCYYVGFGTERNRSLAIEIAENPNVKKSEDALEEEAEEVSGAWIFMNERFRKLSTDGFALMANHVAEYRSNPNYVVEDVIAEYTRESVDIGAAFPDMPEVGLLPKLTLAHLLHDTGFSERAVPLYREAITDIKEASPTKSFREGVSQENLIMNHLADALRTLGRLREAEETAREALALNPTPDNEICLQIKSTLASIHYGREEWSKAADGFREVYDALGELLGARHPNTLHAMGNWAVAVAQDLNRLDEAETLSRQCLDVSRKVLDDTENKRPHELSILAASTLASVLMRRGGRDDEALTMMKSAVEDSSRTIGPLDPVTLAKRAQLAGMYAHQGQRDEAERLYRELLQEQRAIYSEITHPSVLKTLVAFLALLPDERRVAELDAALGNEGVMQLRSGCEGEGGADYPALARFWQAWLR